MLGCARSPRPLGLQLTFANIDGLPAAARHVASRGVLDAAVTDPKAGYLVMGGEATGLNFEDFTTQIKGVADGLEKAKQLSVSEPGVAGARAQLLGLQIGDETLLAAASLGDLDTAGSVTVNMPGATTTVTSMPEKVEAAAALLAQANRARSGSYAVVSWIGYRAPQFHEVGTAYVAKAGAPRLAGFLDGVHESRSKNPAASINVTAHSHGSTTSSYALQRTEHPVDAFLSCGSMAPRRTCARTPCACPGWRPSPPRGPETRRQ